MSLRPSKKWSTTTRTTSSPKRKRSSTARASSKRKSTDEPPRVYLGLGSNLGDRRRFLQRALSRLQALQPLRLLGVSSFYRTDPVGRTDQPDFENAVAEISWRGTPRALLAALKRVERDLGRVDRGTNAPREIDLDILDFGGIVRAAPDPVLPHPRMNERRFVLAPLAEIAPAWRHPVTGRTAKELLAEMPARPRVRKMAQ
ncbi:MAG: 2-amino-4-hydroxy-6-hydroxymethyldihydropteridine diphosphokinase [Acidobacteriota bacterium]|nr:2-amino-4-hydroxy-6-hydroxymethyldihydropteridine diphosphokinase [Acidobacteriota bacterium]